MSLAATFNKLKVLVLLKVLHREEIHIIIIHCIPCKEDLFTSFLCFTLFTGFQLSREWSTNSFYYT